MSVRHFPLLGSSIACLLLSAAVVADESFFRRVLVIGGRLLLSNFEEAVASFVFSASARVAKLFSPQFLDTG